MKPCTHLYAMCQGCDADAKDLRRSRSDEHGLESQSLTARDTWTRVIWQGDISIEGARRREEKKENESEG